jgi:hypothetical protein
MRVRKADVLVPTLPEEVVSVPELGGEVLVRGLDLKQRMTLSHSFRTKPDAFVDFGHLAPLLALTVLDADDQPLFTEAEWAAWGSTNERQQAACRLWDVAWRLSDLDGKQAEKNSTAPTSA